MEKLCDMISHIAEEAFLKAGFEAGFGHVAVSSRPDLSEYQTNDALVLAKRLRKNPMDIAESVAEILDRDPAIQSASAYRPGFINIDISPKFLAEYISEMAEDSELGLEKDDPPKKIVIDYGGANIAKPLHVGHLRSAVIGESLKRIGTAFGNEMIGDVHLGDWGLQIGLIIEELKDRGMHSFTMSDLEEIYPAASAKSKEKDPRTGLPLPEAAAFRERALLATKRLQEGYPEERAVWREIVRLSKEDLEKNYDALDVHFELWNGESDAEEYVAELIENLIGEGIAYESDGALVVDIAMEGDKKEYPPVIVRKSDGSVLYATTDLATIIAREKLLSPDEYIYVADLRQSLHFLGVFRIARKAGLVRDETELRFLGFGTVNGPDGHPLKTRSGGVMRLEYLMDDVRGAVYQKIRENRSGTKMSDEEAEDIASAVAVAALKYGDLSNQAGKDYIFDTERFSGFDGNTGPYILYTVVRIESILKKCEALCEGKSDIYHPDSSKLALAIEASKDLKDLLLKTARFNEAAEAAWQQLAPHKLCQYIYSVSDSFNSFYHNVKVVTEENRDIREGYISSIGLAARVLKKSIWMLGFSAPERM